MTQLIKFSIRFIFLTALIMFTPVFAAEKPVNLDDLLNRLEQGLSNQTSENKQREAIFLQQKTMQTQRLNDAVRQRKLHEKQSELLETQFEENEIKLAGLEEAMNNRLGSLKELFGVLQQVSGDTSNKFKNSIVSAEFHGREKFFDTLAIKMGSSSELASITDIEKVWFELQKEMTESGKVVRFNREVILVNGERVKTQVIRVGTFNLISEGKYLDWDVNNQSVSVFARQPSSRFLETVSDLEASKNDITGFAIDPTGGSILGLLIQAPNIEERIEQGGAVGYVIIILGIIGFIIGLERYIVLSITERKVNQQLKSKDLLENNPLGRVLQTKEKYSTVSEETLELKLGEAMLKEMPKLTRGIAFVKIISVVSPLLGLLGTVTGMINTFQAITLYGTGDPKLMAGGISTALVTTVLGLVVAIPTVMMTTWLNAKSKGILHIIQEQSAGIIADRAEEAEQMNAPVLAHEGA